MNWARGLALAAKLMDSCGGGKITSELFMAVA